MRPGGQGIMTREPALYEHDEARRPLRSGSYDCLPVMPVLTVRELARIDAEGVIANEGLVSREGRVRHAWARRLARADASRQEATPAVSAVQRRQGEQAKDIKLPVRRKRSSGLKMYRPKSVYHEASLRQIGVMDPFVVAGASRYRGPIIGKSLLTGSLWRYDAWAPYQKGDTESVNGWVAGLMGYGKSMFLKAFATRETAPPWGRRIIVEGDPKGEWAAVAERNGGQVVSLHGRNRLNILETGGKPASQTVEEWNETKVRMQQETLGAVANVLRPGTPLTAEESAVMTAALERLAGGQHQVTVTALVSLLADENVVSQMRIRGLDAAPQLRAARSLTLVYDQMVTGPFKHTFEEESTVSIDPDAPMIVFDTSFLSEADAKVKDLYQAAMGSAVERLCRSRDGQWRIVIAEEGAQLLKNPVLVDQWETRMRMSGDLRVSNWILLHELNDINKFAPPDSPERNKISSILTMSSTQVIYTQSASSVGLMKEMIPNLSREEIDQLQALPAYSALWRVGTNVRDIVQARISREAFEVFDTSRNRMG